MSEFIEAIREHGLNPPDVVEPGKFHRFPGQGKGTNNDAGWCKLFLDGQGGVFGDFSTGLSADWFARRERPLGPEKREAFQRQVDEARRQAEAERTIQHAKAAAKAASLWNGALPAPENHAYLVRKGIQAHGLRVDASARLIIPMSAHGEINNVQTISADGQKRFLFGGRVSGCHYLIGEPGKVLCIAEGFATGASIYEATGCAVAVAFNAGNLVPVAEALRKKFPDTCIAICADNDTGTEGNPGLMKAQEAARTVGGLVVIPDFGNDGSDRVTDFNDLAAIKGLETVKAQIEDVLAIDAGGGEENQTIEFPVPSLLVADVRDGTRNTRPLTECGNALRMLDLFGDQVRYVSEIAGWLVWRNGAWVWDKDGADVRTLAACLSRFIYAEGGSFKADDAMRFAAWGRASQSERVVRAVVSLLSDQPGIRLSLARIDADPMLIGINQARSVIDLRTGIVRTARVDDFVTKSLCVEHVGDATKATRWEAFLEQVFDADRELINWMKRWCGYVLTGSTAEQFLLFCYGVGANGKSVLMEILRHVMADYARAVPIETLSVTKRQAGGASPDLAALIGCRLAASSETEDGAALAESLVKSLVSGDTMSARPLYGQPVQFQPEFKLMISGNHRPIIRGNDHGIWRRMRLVPFDRTFAPKERDPHLLSKLKDEAPHILAWMIDGCLEWQRRGLADMPRVVAEQTAAYQEEQDVIGRFLCECTTRDPSRNTTGPELYDVYRQWASRNGLAPASTITFGRRMSERDFKSKRSNGKTVWFGIALSEACNDATYARAYSSASQGW